MLISIVKEHFPTIDFNITGCQGIIGPLHNAVMQFDVDMLEHLLQQNDIDVNYRNVIDETPLLLCLRQSSIQMQQLTQSQANLDIASLMQRQVDIARKLIENGADINARNWISQTALHCAVENNNYECVCMLLHYGIDVSALCSMKRTAFTSALRDNRLDLAEVLFDYYADFSDIDVQGLTALYWAVEKNSPLASKLLQAGVDVNCVVPDYDKNLLMVSLSNDNVDLFKLIWPKFNHRLLLKEREPFLERVINDYSLKRTASDWVECIYLILESPVAFDLLNHYKREIIKYDYYMGNFQFLLYKMIDLKVKASDRIGIIASCLSLGLQASKHDINIIFQRYGFGKELELFIYGADIYDWGSSSDTFLYLVPRYIFAQEDDVNIKKLKGLLWGQFLDFDLKNKEQTRIFLQSLGFFALPFLERHELQLFMQSSIRCNQMIHDRLNNVPELPSLLELARDKARQYIKQKYRVYRAYHLHDAVKRLNLPQRIRDIILFKIQIYK